MPHTTACRSNRRGYGLGIRRALLDEAVLIGASELLLDGLSFAGLGLPFKQIYSPRRGSQCVVGSAPQGDGRTPDPCLPHGRGRRLSLGLALGDEAVLVTARE